MFTTISTYYTFPQTIEQILQNMMGHVTSRYQGLNSSEVEAKIENLGTKLLRPLFNKIYTVSIWQQFNGIL
jgi:hypothetical protein